MPLLNGIEIHLEVLGNDTLPRTLFLNGSGATLARTRGLVEMFASDLHIACHDQRGLGLTEAPNGPFIMADYAADALAVADFLGWPTFRLIGISFGGMVAQEVAVTAPERVERLALVCTSAGGQGGSSYPLHQLAEMVPEERARAYRTLLDTRFTDAWLESHPQDRGLVELMAGRAEESKSADKIRGEWEQLQARRAHDVWGRLERISCPTLIAAGRCDGIAPLDNSMAIASRVSSSDLRIYEGGHAFFLQDARAIPDVRSHLALR